MKPFAYGHATHTQWGMAAALVLTQLRASLLSAAEPGAVGVPDEGCPAPSLGLVYITDHYAGHAQEVLDHLMAELPDVTDWVGTVGVGIAATGVEYFDEPALAVLLLNLPPSQFQVFSGVAPLAPYGQLGGGFVAATALVHADASTPDVEDLIGELAQRTTAGAVFGGLSASRTQAVQFAHSSRGTLGGQGASSGVFSGGLSGVAFGPDVALVTRVTQGCTPLGPRRTVTKTQSNVVLELDGEQALGLLLGDLGLTLDLSPAAMARLRTALVGLEAVSQGGHERGDAERMARRHGRLGAEVRVRHLIGLDPSRGGFAVADVPVPGDTLVLCERNPDAAARDLTRLCAEVREDLESAETEPKTMLGAVYVSCAGRGGPHFGSPSAELQLVRRALGEVPLVGFFAGGEIAGHQLFGYTGVLTVFVAPAGPTPQLGA